MKPLALNVDEINHENRGANGEVDNGKDDFVPECLPAKPVRLNFPGAQKATVDSKYEATDQERHQPERERVALGGKMPKRRPKSHVTPCCLSRGRNPQACSGAAAPDRYQLTDYT